VRALGGLVLAAGGEALEYTVSHLAQRVFDARPSVRLQLAEVLGNLTELLWFIPRETYDVRSII